MSLRLILKQLFIVIAIQCNKTETKNSFNMRIRSNSNTNH
jgi:hypothetical protein